MESLLLLLSLLLLVVVGGLPLMLSLLPASCYEYDPSFPGLSPSQQHVVVGVDKQLPSWCCCFKLVWQRLLHV